MRYVVQPERHHVAHFSWATLRAEVGDPRVAPFVDAVGRVNALAERSPGFVWRSGDEDRLARQAGWPMFKESTRVIASFSVWETPQHLHDFVYRKVHGAFLRRREEWFEPTKASGFVLWWVTPGHVPTIAEARRHVDAYRLNGASAEAFDFSWLDAPARA